MRSDEELSGLRAVILQIAAVVQWIVDVSIDALCLAGLAIGVALVPFRIGGVWRRLMLYEGPREAVREVGPWVLGEALVEVETVGFAIAAPTRWVVLWLDWVDRDTSEFDLEARLFRVQNFFCGLVDLVGFGIGACAVVSPLRLGGLIVALRNLRSRELADRISEARRAAAGYGIAAVLDIVLLPFFVLPLVVPSRTMSHLRTHADIWRQRGQVAESPRRCDDFRILARGPPLLDVHWLWLAQSSLAVVDLFVFLTAGLAVCSLVRARPLAARLMRREETESHVFEGSMWSFEYDWALRRGCVAEFVVAAYDVVGIIPLCVTRLAAHRWPPVREARDARDSGDPQVPLVAWKQLALVSCDLVVLPFAILGACGPRRSVLYAEIRDASNTGLALHRAVLFEAAVAAHDLALLPVAGVALFAYDGCPAAAGAAADASPFAPDGVRAQAWRAFGNCLLDLPLVPLGLFVVLTRWRAEPLESELKTRYRRRRRRREMMPNIDNDKWATRRLVAMEFLRLLRDAACVPLALVLFATLYRWPAVYAPLRARATPPRRGAPTLVATRAELTVATRGGLSLKIQTTTTTTTTTATTTATPVADGALPARLTLRLVGEGAWRRAAEKFGAAAVGVGRAAFPFPLKVGEHVSYDQGILELRFKRARLKATTVAKRATALEDDARFLVQIESRGQTRPVVAIVVRLADVAAAARQPDRPFEIVALGDDDTADAVHLEGGGADGVVDGFYAIVLAQFALLVSDAALLGLCVLVLAVPWRAASLFHALCEPKKRWPYRVASLVSKTVKHAEKSMDAYREALAPILNQAAKECAALDENGDSNNNNSRRCRRRSHLSSSSSGVGPHRHRTSLLSDLAADASKRIEHLAGAHWARWRKMRKRALAQLSLLSRDDEDAQNVAELVEECLEFQDASLYYVWLRADVHGLLVEARRRPVLEDAHSLCVEAIDEAQRAAAAHRAGLRVRLDEAIDRLRATTFLLGSRKPSFSKYGFWHKRPALCRTIILATCAQAALDVGFLVLVAFLVATVYRAIPLARDLYAARAFSVTRATARDVVSAHVRGVGKDAWLVATTSLAVVAVCATVVSIPAFFESLPTCETLADVRSAAVDHLELARRYFGELFALAFAWRTYRVALRATLFAYFAPAAAVADGALVCVADKAMALRLGAAVVAGLGAAAILGRRSALLWGTFLTLVVSAVAPAVLARRSFFTTVVTGAGPPPILPRLTWPNVLALSSIPLDGLACAASRGGVLFGALAAVEWPLPLLYAAVAAAAFWILLVSGPLAELTEDEKNRLEADVPHRQWRHFFGHFLFVFSTHGLVELGRRTGVVSRATDVLLVAFVLSAASALSSLGEDENDATATLEEGRSRYVSEEDDVVLSREEGLDVRYHVRHVAAVRTCQFGVLAAPTRKLAFAAAASWVSVELLFAGSSCPVAFVSPLRVAAAALAALIILSSSISSSSSSSGRLVILAAGIVLVGAVFAALRAYRATASARGTLDATIASVVARVADVHGALFDDEIAAVTGCRAEPWRRKLAAARDVATLGRLLARLEAAILFERLDPDFLATRAHAWRQRLATAKTFEAVRADALVLRKSLRMPARAAILRRELARLAVKKQIPVDLATRVILSFAVAVDASLLRPALLCSTTAHLADRATTAHALRASSQVDCLDLLFSIETIPLPIARRAIFGGSQIVDGLVSHRSSITCPGDERTTGRVLKAAFAAPGIRPLRRLDLMSSTQQPAAAAERLHDHALVPLDVPQQTLIRGRVRPRDDTDKVDLSERIARDRDFGLSGFFFDHRTVHGRGRVFRPNGDAIFSTILDEDDDDDDLASFFIDDN